jgi:hypothetical protein
MPNPFGLLLHPQCAIKPDKISAALLYKPALNIRRCPNGFGMTEAEKVNRLADSLIAFLT